MIYVDAVHSLDIVLWTNQKVIVFCIPNIHSTSVTHTFLVCEMLMIKLDRTTPPNRPWKYVAKQMGHFMMCWFPFWSYVEIWVMLQS